MKEELTFIESTNKKGTRSTISISRQNLLSLGKNILRESGFNGGDKFKIGYNDREIHLIKSEDSINTFHLRKACYAGNCIMCITNICITLKMKLPATLPFEYLRDKDNKIIGIKLTR